MSRAEQNSAASSSSNAATLFNLLKNKMNRVPVSKLFTVIEKSGISLRDPRIKSLIKKINDLRRSSMKSENEARKSFFLDSANFQEVVSGTCEILHKIIICDFVIQNFMSFCEDVRSIFDDCSGNCNGEVANYIPQLARADPKRWGVSICTVDGQRQNMGDTSIPFCIESASKPLNYALAITQLGAKSVHKFIGYEPSGVSFNSITLNALSKPHNPMINAGAIVTCSLLHSKEKMADRFDKIMNSYKQMAGYEHIGFSNSTFLSERNTADRNFCLGYYMQENQCFPPGTQLLEILDFYFQLCAIEITCESGAVIASTLANGGICPLTGERVLSVEAVKDTLSLMHSCGMYDYSGQFAFKVGLPGKSGVSGVILLVVPNLMGMAMWSPPLDKLGNSCRGIQFCQRLVNTFAFHNYDSLLRGKAKQDPRKRACDVKNSEVMQLIFSAQNNDVTALRRASMCGADMNQADYDKRTALHIASAEGNVEAVSFLLEFGEADWTLEDRWGITPYQEALRSNNCAVLEIFKQHMEQTEIDCMTRELEQMPAALRENSANS